MRVMVLLCRLLLRLRFRLVDGLLHVVVLLRYESHPPAPSPSRSFLFWHSIGLVERARLRLRNVLVLLIHIIMSIILQLYLGTVVELIAQL